MESERIHKTISLSHLHIMIIVAGSLGLSFGVASVLFPGLWVLGILAAVFILIAILKRPEIALVGILISTSSIVFEDQLPMLSAGGISIHIPDFLLLGLLALIIIRWLVEPSFKLIHTPLDWPLFIFYSVTLLSTIIALINSTADGEMARRMLRFLTYYLSFFAVTNLVKTRRQLNFLLNCFFLLATMVGALMVAQYILGKSVSILPGRVETLNTQGVAYAEIIRILPPGLSILLVAFVTIFCILIIEKFKPSGWLRYMQFGLLGLAVIFTFLRSYWIALIAVFGLLLFILKGHDRQKFITWGIVIFFSAGTIIALISFTPISKISGLVSASSARITTVLNPGTYKGEDSSLSWRVIENNYALEQIISHPILGLGLGSLYRPYDSRLDSPGNDLRWLIHNGHYRILLDSGIVGYLAFLWLSITFIIRGFWKWKSVADNKLKAIVLGFTLIYLAVLVAAVVNSPYMSWSWTPVFGIIMGINEVIYKNDLDEQPAV